MRTRRSRILWFRLRSSDGGAAAFRVDVETDDSAQSHGVHAGEVREVEDDAPVSRQKLGYGIVELIGVFGGELALAANEDVGGPVLRSRWRRGLGVGGVLHGRSFGEIHLAAWDRKTVRSLLECPH